MKTFAFKQNDLKRAMLFAVIYCVAVFVVCNFYFGSVLGMANALHNISSAKASGLLIGTAVLAQFFVMLKQLCRK